MKYSKAKYPILKLQFKLISKFSGNKEVEFAISEIFKFCDFEYLVRKIG